MTRSALLIAGATWGLLAGGGSAHAVAVPQQLPGRAGCVGPVSGCASFRDAALGFLGWTVAPDQRFFYGATGRAVVTLRPDPRTGELRRAPGRTLQGARRVAISPDGRHLYALQKIGADTAVLTFARNRRTGALRRLPGARGCLATRRIPRCRLALGLRSTAHVAFEMDPSGRSMVAAGAGRIVVYRRAPRDGTLKVSTCFGFRALPGCQTLGGTAPFSWEITVTFAPGGGSVWVTYSGYEGDVDGDLGTQVRLQRDPQTGALRPLADAPAGDTLDWPPVFLDATTAVVPSSSRFSFSARVSVVSSARPPSAGDCWGRASPLLPAGCQATPGLGWWLAPPVLSPDRGTVYVASGRRLATSGRVLAFPVSGDGGLAAPTVGRWSADRNEADWVRNPWPFALRPSRDARRLFLYTDGPALHTFTLLAGGGVAAARSDCLGTGPGCRRARGLVNPDWGAGQESTLDPVELVESRDRRFLYVLSRAAAVFRVEA